MKSTGENVRYAQKVVLLVWGGLSLDNIWIMSPRGWPVATINTHTHTYMFVGVNFDAQEKREVISNGKETSCLPLLNAGFEPQVSGTESAADWMSLDNIWIMSPRGWPVATINTHTHTYMFVGVNFDAQEKREVISNGKETSCLPLLNAGFEPQVSGTESAADWMPVDTSAELSRVKLKT